MFRKHAASTLGIVRGYNFLRSPRRLGLQTAGVRNVHVANPLLVVFPSVHEIKRFPWISLVYSGSTPALSLTLFRYKRLENYCPIHLLMADTHNTHARNMYHFSTVPATESKKKCSHQNILHRWLQKHEVSQNSQHTSQKRIQNVNERARRNSVLFVLCGLNYICVDFQVASHSFALTSCGFQGGLPDGYKE